MKYTAVIVNSRFLQRPEKRSRMKPAYSPGLQHVNPALILIHPPPHTSLNQDKSIDSGVKIQRVMHSDSQTGDG